MHIKLLTKYYFINTLDTNNFKKQDKETIVIYRNYSSLKIDTDKLDSSAAKNLEKFYKKISKELEDHIEEYSWINFF